MNNSGDDKWNHSDKIQDFIENNNILGDYGINFKIFLIKENAFSPEELMEIGNIVSTLFLAESYYDIDLITEQIEKLMDSEGITIPLKLFLNYFQQLSINEKIEPIDYNIIESIYSTREEVSSMMLTAIRKEKEKLRKEGEQIGIVKGENKKSIKIATEMLKKGFELKLISELTGLSEEEVNRLQ